MFYGDPSTACHNLPRVTQITKQYDTVINKSYVGQMQNIHHEKTSNGDL